MSQNPINLETPPPLPFNPDPNSLASTLQHHPSSAINPAGPSNPQILTPTENLPFFAATSSAHITPITVRMTQSQYQDFTQYRAEYPQFQQYRSQYEDFQHYLSEYQTFRRYRPLYTLLETPLTYNTPEDIYTFQTTFSTIVRNSRRALDHTYAQFGSTLVPPPLTNAPPGMRFRRAIGLTARATSQEREERLAAICDVYGAEVWRRVTDMWLDEVGGGGDGGVGGIGSGAVGGRSSEEEIIEVRSTSTVGSDVCAEEEVGGEGSREVVDEALVRAEEEVGGEGSQEVFDESVVTVEEQGLNVGPGREEGVGMVIEGEGVGPDVKGKGKEVDRGDIVGEAVIQPEGAELPAEQQQQHPQQQQQQQQQQQVGTATSAPRKRKKKAGGDDGGGSWGGSKEGRRKKAKREEERQAFVGLEGSLKNPATVGIWTKLKGYVPAGFDISAFDFRNRCQTVAQMYAAQNRLRTRRTSAKILELWVGYEFFLRCGGVKGMDAWKVKEQFRNKDGKYSNRKWREFKLMMEASDMKEDLESVWDSFIGQRNPSPQVLESLERKAASAVHLRVEEGDDDEEDEESDEDGEEQQSDEDNADIAVDRENA
ncbi:hypothetical protein HDV00_012543 [Rhizophlyctis rosea]|nr:hypothetical protein HDV00_012543 [Rhizophlyctis rosea]